MSKTVLHVSSTWNGSLLCEGAQTRLELKPLESEIALRVSAPFHNDPPPEGPPGSTDGLWDYEVVELFISGTANEEGLVPYIEIEMSPHGHYLVLEFLGERQRVKTYTDVDYQAIIDGERWFGDMKLPRSWLPEGKLRCNSYAIRGQGRNRGYFAMRPMGGKKPDFHRLEFFKTLSLDWSEADGA